VARQYSSRGSRSSFRPPPGPRSPRTWTCCVPTRAPVR
jgi:hypothetical protein